MYMNQQDAQNSCDYTLFSIRYSTCFGHVWYMPIRLAARRIGIYQMRCTAYKVVPDDGII